MSTARELLRSYLRQRQELGDTEIFLDRHTTADLRDLLTRTPVEAVAEAPAPGARAEEIVQLGSLDELRAVALGCPRCRLAETRRHVVFGEGSAAAQVVVVGEAPGADEDRSGRPFVGPAGKLLTQLLASVGLAREEVYICNVLKCLRYNALVQLGDGSWRRIGNLVRERYTGTVMSVDEAGNLVPRRVLGGYASPLGRRSVYRLSYASAKRVGRSYVGVQVTGDHRVLTEGGYVAVQDLEPDAKIATGQGLSDTAWDVVWGSLLGDGSIAATRAHLQFSHSERQREYALFKADLLADLRCVSEYVKVAAGGDQRYPAIITRSRASRALRLIRDQVYVPKKRVPVGFEAALSPRMVAIWFMDDGYLRLRPPRSPSAEIATCSFPIEDLETLVRGLARLGVHASIRRRRIFFDVQNTMRLSELIAPFVPPSMRWKLHPSVASRIPFDPEAWVAGPKRVLYDTVYVEKLEHTGSDKTFFCLDVEETHNFVTSGGVVHNCRPPGNRNPQPEEIAACSPYLLRQIELIRPRVVLACGTFAAQTLLRTTVSIGQLRGRVHEYHGVPLVPTYHPAALLRNAGWIRPVWEDLQRLREVMEG